MRIARRLIVKNWVKNCEILSDYTKYIFKTLQLIKISYDSSSAHEWRGVWISAAPIRIMRLTLPYLTDSDVALLPYLNYNFAFCVLFSHATHFSVSYLEILRFLSAIETLLLKCQKFSVWLSIPNALQMHCDVNPGLHERLSWGLKDGAVNQNMIRNWNFFLIICTDHSYFFGDFSTYKFKLSCFANNLYFGHNWTSVSFRVSFQSEISIQVHMIPSWHFIPDCMSVLSGMKNGMNPTRMSYNSIRIHANKYNLIPYGYGQNKNRMSL